ncbi:hypothetical protein CKA15_060 [Listeria phage cka15]|nr:hypothetical protein CKA15_060 [Listeria phage cka15]
MCYKIKVSYLPVMKRFRRECKYSFKTTY